jgi:Skp family chaperone for outer membrane proteins
MRPVTLPVTVMCALLGTHLYAQSMSIHNVALLDWDAVLTAYYADTAEIREYRRISAETKNDLAAFDKQIGELDQGRTVALAKGDSKLAGELSDRLVRVDNERSVLVEVRRRSQRDLLTRLTQGATYRAILQAVESVAWEKGFSHVRRIDENDLWWSQDIDITVAVIDALRTAATGR